MGRGGGRRGGGEGGGRGGKKGRGSGGSHEGGSDQYGSFGGQDRDADRGPPRGGGHSSAGGGGSAGSQTRHKGGDLSYQRHIPKFLQAHAHLLGQGRGADPNNKDGGDEDAPVTVGTKRSKDAFSGWEEDEATEGGRARAERDDDDVEEDALRRAIAENPKLAAEFEGKLAVKLAQAQAKEEKEKGNRAFGAKQYPLAIKHFTKAIDLDPEGEVYWSNRSAAHAALEQWEEAAADAQRAVTILPRWAKAHSRLAVAYYGLKLYGDAVATYRRALLIEPDDHALQAGLHKAEGMEAQQAASGTHVFKKARLRQGPAAAAGQEAGTSKKEVAGASKQAAFSTPSLSFADDDG